MVASPFLNYTVLGRNSFEVFSYYTREADVQIEAILQEMCSQRGLSYASEGAEFWLVCVFTTLNIGPTDGLLFPVERTNSL